MDAPDNTNAVAPGMQTQDNGTANQPHVPPTLMTIPAEIRTKVCAYLLRNPGLKWDDPVWLDNFQHGLYPQILRTCRQIYQESSSILNDGQRPFLISCPTVGSRKLSIEYPSPLTRNSTVTLPADPYEDYKVLRSCRNFSGVKNWVVRAPGSASGFLSICRALCHLKLNTLTVLQICLICAADLDGVLVTTAMEDDLQRFAPLKLLRDVRRLVFRCMDCGETEDIINEEAEAELKRIIEYDTPVDHVFEMYDKLLCYAQAFERHPRFRNDMASIPCRRPAVITFGSRRPNVPSTTLNPYQFECFHPVESNLHLAKEASNGNEISTFKNYRKEVLQFLEPQYQRIIAASKNLHAFIKREKTGAGVLDAHPPDHAIYDPRHDGIRVEGTLLVEDFASSFTRDVTPEIRLVMRKYRWIMENITANMDREVSLKRLNVALDMEDTDNWERYFKEVAGAL
ncbi:hypothetical protein G7Y89_g15064 [Cudoniella acicularis]|uniref:Uncharacterized protein n=1 Tax=Cudoniella acicularis TaxID=354080 RepID=A0A8H4QTT2_9HELO|nr:hypothetical protein G7Y89_g15064 [Cudoniella acicularis]